MISPFSSKANVEIGWVMRMLRLLKGRMVGYQKRELGSLARCHTSGIVIQTMAAQQVFVSSTLWYPHPPPPGLRLAFYLTASLQSVSDVNSLAECSAL